jgi:hypothetical protein
MKKPRQYGYHKSPGVKHTNIPSLFQTVPWYIFPAENLANKILLEEMKFQWNELKTFTSINRGSQYLKFFEWFYRKHISVIHPEFCFVRYPIKHKINNPEKLAMMKYYEDKYGVEFNTPKQVRRLCQELNVSEQEHTLGPVATPKLSKENSILLSEASQP